MAYEHLSGNKHALGNFPNKTSFKKGDIPWNKGLKGIHLSPNTEFKKGGNSISRLPLGTIRVRKSKNGKMRNFIKITEPNVWREYSWYKWKSAFGFIKGDVIHHINGNVLDDKAQNLIAIPRADHPKFHSRWGLKQFSESQIISYYKRYFRR